MNAVIAVGQGFLGGHPRLLPENLRPEVGLKPVIVGGRSGEGGLLQFACSTISTAQPVYVLYEGSLKCKWGLPSTTIHSCERPKSRYLSQRLETRGTPQRVLLPLPPHL